MVGWGGGGGGGGGGVGLKFWAVKRTVMRGSKSQLAVWIGSLKRPRPGNSPESLRAKYPAIRRRDCVQ